MSTRRTIAAAVLCTAVIAQSACGTLLHPERKGQAQTNRLDASVVILDGIGLFFFFIPGLVAFAVDFGNNTIYLPDDESASAGDAITLKLADRDAALDGAAVRRTAIEGPAMPEATVRRSALGRAIAFDAPLDAATIETVIERELAVAGVIGDDRLEVRSAGAAR